MAHFSFPMVRIRQSSHEFRQLLGPVVESMGYELIGVEFHPHSSNALLRVYIDKESGVSVDDCQGVSHQVGSMLDVADLISGHYTLEVSSPGLDRPLFEAEHFVRFAGHKVRVHLVVSLNGRRKLIGRLLGMHGDNVAIEDDGMQLLIPLDRIEKARLIPEF